MASTRYSVFFDGSKTTSGQRFFSDLCEALGRMEGAVKYPCGDVVVFNVSAPVKQILLARLKGRKVIVRVDGLYFDRLSLMFLLTFPWPLRAIFSLGLRWRRLAPTFAHLANLFNQNWTGFLRILLAHKVIYQSCFSQAVYRRYFPRKAGIVIVNGSRFIDAAAYNRLEPSNTELRLIAVHDDWRPSKRIADLVEFVVWANEVGRVETTLTLLGYNGGFPTCVAPEVKRAVENKPYFRTFPKFRTLDGSIGNFLINSDMYVTLSLRDACPNTVVEAMAHGLPVLGVSSGGIPDIVGDAGVLMADGDVDGFFAAARYECDFPKVDFEQMLKGALEIKGDMSNFRQKVRRRFETDLGIDMVASRYWQAINSTD